MTPLPIIGFFGEYRWLSNFWYATIVHQGISYPTNEHFYQCHKTTDRGLREALLHTPLTSLKREARTVPLRRDWDTYRDRVMLTAIRLKFEQHPDLWSKLKKTDWLEERNTWNDTYWGTIQAGPKIVGQNRLGRLLMAYRDKRLKST